MALSPVILPVSKPPLSAPLPPSAKPTLWAIVRQNAPEYWHGFVRFASTPSGAFITFMMAMFVFWGAFLFLLLVKWANFATADQQSLWVEITSQVENGFFSIMGLGLFPQRIWVLVCAVQLSRHRGDSASATLWAARIKRQYGWFNMEDTPTRRAFPWKTFKLALFLYLLHSCLQCCISGIMWGFNRYNRSNIAIGLLIPLSCIDIIAAEVVIALQGRKLVITTETEDDWHPDESQLKDIV